MSQSSAANFDRLARIYRLLEYVAHGRTLAQVRRAFIAELRDCRHILIVGEGDGRFLAQLVHVARSASIHCIDASRAMLAAARARLPSEARSRVTFSVGDIRTMDLDGARYDAVVTLFLLDCFTDDEVNVIVQRIAAVLSPDARWIFGDYALPDRRFARWRARLWLTVLYSFFRWETGLSARRLPDMDGAITRAGFVAETTRLFHDGQFRTAVYRRG